LVNKFADLLFNCYFEKRSKNKIAVKFENVVIEKESKSDITLKDEIYGLLRAYSTYFVNQFYHILENPEFYGKLEKLFKGEEAHDRFGLLSSGAYGLIEYSNGIYRRSKDIISVLKRFRYDPKHMRATRMFPSFQTVKNDQVETKHF